METLTVVLVAGAVAALAGGYFLWSRLRGVAEEPMYHFRCPGCDRRLRYRARQVGHRGECSHCGQQLYWGDSGLSGNPPTGNSRSAHHSHRDLGAHRSIT